MRSVGLETSLLHQEVDNFPTKMVLEETGISTAEGYMHSCSVKLGLLNSAAPCEERAFLMSHTPTPSQQWDPPEKPR